MLEQVIQKFAQQLSWSVKAQMLQEALQCEDIGVWNWLLFFNHPATSSSAQLFMP